LNINRDWIDVETSNMRITSLLLCAASAAGCAAQRSETLSPTWRTSVAAMPAAPQAATFDPAKFTFNLVTARNATRSKGVSDITQSFGYEGRIFAISSITWRAGEFSGALDFTSRWYNAHGLVFEQKHRAKLKNPPHYVYFATTGVALGPCGCKVELLADNHLVASQEFSVQPH
jgi:hypothetical protein